MKLQTIEKELAYNNIGAEKREYIVKLIREYRLDALRDVRRMATQEEDCYKIEEAHLKRLEEMS